MGNKNNLVSNQLAAEYPTAFLTFMLGIGTALFYVIMTICVFVAFGSFFMLHNPKAAIEALIIGLIDTVNDNIKNI